MCIMPKSPKPPPITPAEPPPPAPKRTDENVKRAKTNQKRIQARAQGRSGTLLGGQLKSSPANSAGKTLLGQ